MYTFEITALSPRLQWVNSLWPSDAIWRHTSLSTLAQVMACCLTAPSHYLNQCLLIANKVLQLSPEGNFMGNAQEIYAFGMKNDTDFILELHLPGANELMVFFSCSRATLYNRMKLMFVGVQGIGKTSLLAQMRKAGRGPQPRNNKVRKLFFLIRIFSWVSHFFRTLSTPKYLNFASIFIGLSYNFRSEI